MKKNNLITIDDRSSMYHGTIYQAGISTVLLNTAVQLDAGKYPYKFLY